MDHTPARDFVKALATNATDSSFPSKVATATEPANDGVIALTYGSLSVYNNVLLCPYGVGADNSTFSLRVIGWRKISTLWVPVPLCEVTCTLSTSVGVAGQSVLNTERFADTLSLASGYNSNVSVELVSPTGNVNAHLLLDVKGFKKLELTFSMGGSATSGNALYAGL